MNSEFRERTHRENDVPFASGFQNGRSFSLGAIIIVHGYHSSRALVVQGGTVYGAFDCNAVHELYYNIKIV